ncbi:MAG: DUF1501 domain-containing protein [Epsilonproteobacteria bacterium]|nr:DUF1501 domain-containing protein [Campylobacterota bacterium]
MNRRNFIKQSTLLGSSLLLSSLFCNAKTINYDEIEFDSNIYEKNAPQTIVIFLYGGASELGGNLTNIEEIKQNSQSSYDDYFRGVTPTENGFWREAGGEIMEELLASGDMTIFRTCYSYLRDKEKNKSHGRCVSQNQRGVNNDEDTAGVFAIIGDILYKNGVITKDTKLPFITMEGDNTFYSSYEDRPSFLKPISIDKDLSNPYERRWVDSYFYYTKAERENKNYKEKRALLDMEMDRLSAKKNGKGPIEEAFEKRVELEKFVNSLKEAKLPDGVKYPEKDSFAKKLQVAVNLCAYNPDTRVVTIGSGGLGGWDDHNEARDYPQRMVSLFSAIKSAVDHIKALKREDRINILVFGEFGRNVNLNAAKGWDHGNNQNLFSFLGKNYFNELGVVGETYLPSVGEVNRMYLKPKPSSYSFEPFSIAATLYKIYGIKNPQVLTGGFGEIKEGFLKF